MRPHNIYKGNSRKSRYKKDSKNRRDNFDWSLKVSCSRNCIDRWDGWDENLRISEDNWGYRCAIMFKDIWRYLRMSASGCLIDTNICWIVLQLSYCLKYTFVIIETSFEILMFSNYNNYFVHIHYSREGHTQHNCIIGFQQP